MRSTIIKLLLTRFWAISLRENNQTNQQFSKEKMSSQG